MNRRLSLFAVSALLVFAFSAVPLAASDDDGGKRVTISERTMLTSPTTQSGTFAAAGAINDAGTVTVEFTITPLKGGVGRITGTHVLQGSQGTISIFTDAKVRPFPPPTPPRVSVEGGWRISDATGGYAGLRGRGTITAVVDLTTSQVTIVREGRVRLGGGDD